ncbi:GNAT family N-acetyltransferase [Streptomyces sp. B3I8]|uniref:GNAT family N-acetyltransferase n=1 Tax=Streptomyces sp. B3I8 TaxID=3042303 RepID=UPI0027820292|nr:GNAT family N-acetyltransferase [Streptomyces sp. B3I8]MDQ0786609.1 RimJ/RimL family protein N-acetyltransferase [Streptomyces sp. B3I8]
MTVTLRVGATPSASALVLRPWDDVDVEPLVEAYRDPALRRWSSHPVESVEGAAAWLESQRRGWETGERLSFAVVEDRSGVDGGRLVGHVVLKRGGSSGRASAEVGYWTAAHARGRGVAPRALEALTGWAFDVFAGEGLKRLDLLHQVDNLASCRVAEKAGYGFHRVLPAQPPFPSDGHLHRRKADTAA